MGLPQWLLISSLLFVVVALQIIADGALLATVVQPENRHHGPWAIFAVGGVLVVWMGVGAYLGREVQLAHRIRCAHSDIETFDLDTALKNPLPAVGEIFGPALTSVALTGAAIWTSAAADLAAASQSGAETAFAQFDVWIPCAIGFQAASVGIVAKAADVMTEGRLRWVQENEGSGEQRALLLAAGSCPAPDNDAV